MGGFKKLLGVMVGSHYKMERFCATFLAFAIALGSMFGICMKIHVDNQKLNLGTQARYTVKAQFSLSQDTVEVVNVYRNTNYTKAFVLLKVPNMQNLPTNAEDYKMFMTSYEKKKPLTCNPTAAIYMFGNTGYIGLYFADDAGFQPALYDVVLRNTRMIVQGDADKAAASFKDGSYARYNQMHFYANFAGSDALIADFLNSAQPEVRDIYVELISERNADAIRNELNTTLLEMNSSMSTINEYARRLDSAGISVPALPVSIASDYITTEGELTRGNPSAFTTSMLNQGTVTVNTQYNVTVDSSDENTYQSFVTGDNLYLVTNYVFPGGVQFNYQDVKISENFTDGLKPEGLTYEQWISTKKTEGQQYMKNKATVTFSDWTYKTGQKFQRSEYDAASQAIYQDIQIYQQAVQQLNSLKYQYQTIQLFELLTEDMASRSIASVFSVRSDVDTVTLY